MKNSLKTLILLAVGIGLVGCASVEKRTKYTDKNMRIMIDPASVNPDTYAKIMYSLQATEMWTIIDRSNAFEAIKHEQEELHRTAIDRYEDKEKWAQWGKLYGIGAVVVGHNQCRHTTKTFRGRVLKCQQYLTIVDANTGEVIAAVANDAYSDPTEYPSWDDAAEKLAAAYPKDFSSKPNSERLEMYKLESKEAAQRQKEVVVQQSISESK